MPDLNIKLKIKDREVEKHVTRLCSYVAVCLLGSALVVLIYLYTSHASVKASYKAGDSGIIVLPIVAAAAIATCFILLAIAAFKIRECKKKCTSGVTTADEQLDDDIDYSWCTLGAVVSICAAFIAVMCIPTMLSPSVTSSIEMSDSEDVDAPL